MPRKHSPFIVCDFEVKNIKEDDPNFYIVEGFASIYGNIDSYRDIVMPGAFTKDLLENGNERPILWQHRSDEPIGLGTFTDKPEGLFVSIKLPKDDDFVAKRVMPQVKVGSVKGLSIGYMTLIEEWDRDQNVNRLKEIKLRETSAVTFSANPLSLITAAKQFLGIDTQEKSFKDYPLADDKTEFNFNGTLENLKKTIGTDSENYEKCFLIQNGEKSQVPYADFIKGDLRIIPEAIYTATANFIQSKSDNQDAKDFINKIYAKMGQEIPFQENNIFVDHKTFEALKKQDLTAIFNSDVVLSNSVKNLIIKELGSQVEGSVQEDSSDFMADLKSLNKSIGEM